MKRIVSLAVAVIMLLTMSSFSAFAVTINEIGDAGNYDVYVNYDEDNCLYEGDQLSVDVSWGSLEFDYYTVKEWNPVTHVYDDGVGYFQPVTYDADLIIITNNSVREIQCNFAYNEVSDSGVSGSFEFEGDYSMTYSDGFVLTGWYNASYPSLPKSRGAALILSAESYNALGRTKVGTVTVTIGPVLR